MHGLFGAVCLHEDSLLLNVRGCTEILTLLSPTTVEQGVQFEETGLSC